MNRPRNRQPRPPRGGSSRGGRGDRAGQGSGEQHDRNPTWTAGTPQQAAGTVPTLQQVIPGAPVFIILKEDQATGKETQGVVQDLLTRGNHPRGIKVRLRGGLIGRVQRMASEELTPSEPSITEGLSGHGVRQSPLVASRIKYRDIREEDEGWEQPPQRSLADYLPKGFEELDTGGGPETSGTGGKVVKCPFCEDFEGDEVAVSYHVDQKHLS
ncbi:hypothetical protein NLU13_6007 [Sarocladium strictum]|uniref:Uncharacterized protein n=1 Tax=Sarocladium strictum TaxID=5046 RepID=A0AA39GF34_SARSR|nr:hypothetical protein NLU13_6007 [Sarocladium strictum]